MSPTASKTDPRWIGSKEAAEHLGVSIASIRRWCDDEKIPHWTTPGGQRRFSIEDLDRWIDEHKIEAH